VLLTHKIPEPGAAKSANSVSSVPLSRVRNRKVSKTKTDDDEDPEDPNDEHAAGEDQVLWGVGEVSDGEDEGDDEDIDHHQHPLQSHRTSVAARSTSRFEAHGEEGRGLMNADGVHDQDDDAEAQVDRHRGRAASNGFKDDEEFGQWTGAR